MQGNGVKESLKAYAKLLKLPTFSEVEAGRLRPGESIEEFVLELMKREYDSRQEKSKEARIKRVRFPVVKTLEEFDLSRLEHIRPEYVKQLAGCEFVKRHENIVMIGNPGTGKTHLMTALGLRACVLGYRVMFRTAASLATELLEARDNYQLRRIEKAIAGADLLLVDELSYASFRREESELLFRVIAERSERASTVITTNLEFSRWTELFESEGMVAALVDRLTYRSAILNMNGESYRLRSSRQKRKSA